MFKRVYLDILMPLICHFNYNMLLHHTFDKNINIYEFEECIDILQIQIY